MSAAAKDAAELVTDLNRNSVRVMGMLRGLVMAWRAGAKPSDEAMERVAELVDGHERRALDPIRDYLRQTSGNQAPE